MKKIILIVMVLFSLTFVGSVLAGEITSGSDSRGAKLSYEGFNLGSNGIVRFSIECVKNWGGEVAGVVTVVAYYLDSSGNVQLVSEAARCHVQGGHDGARKRSSSEPKTIKIPVILSEAEVKAYIGHKEISNVENAFKNLENTINKTFEETSAGLIKKPLSFGKTLEEAVVPAGGHKLTF